MKYFKIEELTCSITAQHLGIDNTPSKEAVRNLEALVKGVLDPLREAWGGPIIVNSGYRSEELNRAVGGVKNSYHRLGMAADIRPKGGRYDLLYDLIVDMFMDGKIGLAECYIDYKKEFVHVAYDIEGFNVWPFIEKS